MSHTKQYEEQSDVTLVSLVQSGDDDAFSVLVKRYERRVCALVSRYVGNRGEVADVAQEAFIKTYRALSSFRGESGFYTWLYRITVNTAKNYLVAQNRRPPGQDIEYAEVEQFDGLKETCTPEDVMICEEIEADIHDVISNLPEDLRCTIMLRELDGYSYEQIAEVMSCPIGTVRSRIFRAREAIDLRLS